MGSSGAQFYSDFKVLPLQHFDIILGYDWLELIVPWKCIDLLSGCLFPMETGLQSFMAFSLRFLQVLRFRCVSSLKQT
jgi:hypothetical protein